MDDPTRGHSDPGRCWTFTNMSEATPDIMTPLCVSFWTGLGEVAARRGWYAIGLLPRSAVHLPTDQNELTLAPFYGRQALNVDRLATMMGALPGTSRQEVERSFLGHARTEEPPDRPPRRRGPFVATKAPIALARQARAVQRFYPEQLAWWQRDVFGGGEQSSRALLEAARDRFAAAMYLHGKGRFLSQALLGAVTKLAEDAGVPELATSVYSGFGGMVETALAEDMWAVSRGSLDEAGFLRRHGYHGSGVGNLTGVPWREDPAPVRAMCASLSRRPDGEQPRLRAREAAARSLEAQAQLRAAVPRRIRPILPRLIRLTGSQVRCVEATKSGFLMALDGGRKAAAGLGESLAADGRLADPSDAVFLGLEELLGEIPSDSADLATFRRARRDEYRKVQLPTTFVGMPEPIAVAETRAQVDELTGAAGSAGTAQGRARVVTDLNLADELEPGEILVCRYTDPAWVAAMALADGLVIDVGAAGSHGAIVARELGIPCVIGTGDGTTQIRSGDLIRVDGTRGIVQIVEREGTAHGSRASR